MNKRIEIEQRAGMFFVFLRYMYVRMMVSGYSYKEYHNELIAVAGGQVGDLYAESRMLAQERAEKYRETHSGIEKIVFKKGNQR